MRILIIAGVPLDFGGGGQRPAHLYRAFLKLGYDVKYYFPPYQKFDFNYDNFDLVIIEYPFKELANIVPKLKGKCKIIYEVLDDWQELFSPIYDKSSEKVIIDNCDFITAVSKELCDKYIAFHSPNAVDLDLINDKRFVKAKLDGDTSTFKIGYVGHLENHWFDWDIIKELSNNSKYSIHLVGKCSNKPLLANNLHYYSLKKYDEIPAYINSFDLCIIPFKIGKLFNSVSPLKLYEYLACEKPVVSFNTKEKYDFELVSYANNISEFLLMVDFYYLLKKNGDNVEYYKKVDFNLNKLKQHSWTERAKELLKQVGLRND